uniref:Uncharacterized protein n=1 Tax=viral metagenome TaxID=1070528 RepID=A0A6M3IM32_9ZZZZ
MKLSVLDRLVLLNILPQENNYTTLKIIRGLKDELGFSESEHKVLCFNNEGGGLKWNEGVDDKEVNIGEKATDIIVEAFKELDREKRLHADHVSLYERFIGGQICT